MKLGFTSCVTVPWSAVFVSWCMKHAGASVSEFKFSAAHSAFVGEDAAGRFALTIGGNEGNSIRRTIVRLTPEGFIKQRANNPFTSVVKNLK